MSVAGHEVSRAGPDLHRLGRMVAPRWLRQRRREQSRAARRAVAADVADGRHFVGLPGLEVLG
jgi:hypothetical protein